MGPFSPPPAPRPPVPADPRGKRLVKVNPYLRQSAQREVEFRGPVIYAVKPIAAQHGPQSTTKILSTKYTKVTKNSFFFVTFVAFVDNSFFVTFVTPDARSMSPHIATPKVV